MENYERFKLTPEEVQEGIDDFFTQILIQARRSSIDAKTLSDLSSTTPRVSYLVGQPGSGKSTLGRCIESELKRKGEFSVELSSDKIATYHRYYEELLKLLPEDCYTISRQFVRPASKVIQKGLTDKKINITREEIFNKGEIDYENMQKFRDSGYSIDLNVMAVDKYESFLSCMERDIKLLELGHDPRPVARANHDRMYDPFLLEIMEMTKRGLCDSIKVYARGESTIYPKLVWKTGDVTYASAQEAVIAERAKSRRALLADPTTYLSRIRAVRNKITFLVTDPNLRANYLEELSQLEAEFFNELSFDRNNK